MEQKRLTKLNNYGLSYWMQQVVKCVPNARRSLRVDTVHRLRVSLRRCRSMASQLKKIDPKNKALYNSIHGQAKKLFKKCAPLRDNQVMHQWIEQFTRPGSKTRIKYFNQLKKEGVSCRKKAKTGLKAFSMPEWKKKLNQVKKIKTKSEEEFFPLAKKMFQKTKRQLKKGLRQSSDKNLHQLRITNKKLRYLFENFMPGMNKKFGKDLKKMHDLLGDMHDLTVLKCPELKKKMNQTKKAKLKKFKEHSKSTKSVWAKIEKSLKPSL